MTVHQRIIQLLALLHELLVGLGHIQLRHGVWKREARVGSGVQRGAALSSHRTRCPAPSFLARAAGPAASRVREDESRAGDSPPSNSTGSTCVWRLSGANATALHDSVHGWLNPSRRRNGRQRRLTSYMWIYD